MTKPRTKQSPARRRARHRRQEGMALLVIMLIIVITTAAAAVSVQNTTAEMNAAGKERMLAQAHYGSEAAMQATIAWLDLVGNSNSFLQIWNDWGNLEPPEMRPYTGGHQIQNDASRHHAARSLQTVQAMLPQLVIAPVSGPNPGLPIPDFTGSFGPNQPYSMEPYVIDITDCIEAPKTMTKGGNMNLSASGLTSKRFFCTLTARGRIVMNGNSGAGVTWDLPGGMNAVFQERSGAAYDTRATMLLPELLLPNN